MIRSRITKQVPVNAVNVAYVYGPPFTVGDNISLMDLSYSRAENVLAYGSEVVIDLNSSAVVDTEDINVSNLSVLHRNINVPKPLYYKHRIGTGVQAEVYKVYTLEGSADDNVTRDTIRKQLIILDRDNNPIDIDWDIRIAGNDGSTGYDVDLYLSRRPREDETFKVKYTAKSTSGLLPNHIEVINSSPILTAGSDYTLTEQANGYSMAIDIAVSSAPGLGVFYRGSQSSGTVEITSSYIRLREDDNTPHDVTLAGKSVIEVAAELNELELDEYWITPLSESTTSRFVTGTFYPKTAGLELILDNIVHVKYNEETRMRLLKPYADPTSKPWYPRIDPGQFLQSGSIGSNSCYFQFKVPEYDNQTWSYTYGQPYRDMVNDYVEVIGSNMLKTHRAPIKAGTVVLREQTADVSDKIHSIDLQNGIIFLNQKVRSEPTADYSYEERSYVYKGVDLNTTTLHSPQNYGKYIGIYATPYKILSSTPSIQQTFSVTIRHVIKDTYTEVVDAVNSVLFDDSSDPKAFLLGVFRPVLVSDTDDIRIVDTRTRGGGLNEDISSTVEPETDFFWDIGYWGGKPFQDKGAIVVGIPTNVIGTGIPSLRMDIPVPTSGYVTPTGLLTREFVQAVIDRHIAAGHLGIMWPRTGLVVD